MSTLNRVTKTAVYETSAFITANPNASRLALIALTAVIAAASLLFNVNPVAACGDISAGGGGC
jgi:hypothetical protein